MVKIADNTALDNPQRFAALCQARALLWQNGEPPAELSPHVDRLHAWAVENGVVAALGEDAVTAIIAQAFAEVRDDL